MSEITHKSFFEEVWYKEGELDWDGGWERAQERMNRWITANKDTIEVINVETYDRPIQGSSIAQQRRSGGGVGYRVIYRMEL
jgi:hypothetical protein